MLQYPLRATLILASNSVSGMVICGDNRVGYHDGTKNDNYVNVNILKDQMVYASLGHSTLLYASRTSRTVGFDLDAYTKKYFSSGRLFSEAALKPFAVTSSNDFQSALSNDPRVLADSRTVVTYEITGPNDYRYVCRLVMFYFKRSKPYVVEIFYHQVFTHSIRGNIETDITKGRELGVGDIYHGGFDKEVRELLESRSGPLNNLISSDENIKLIFAERVNRPSDIMARWGSRHC
jgi:hypothetical protein